MRIRKVGQQPENHFTIVRNDMVRDASLSFRARGVLTFICSHADGFHINANILAREGTEGRDAMRTAMNELVERGYLRRVRSQEAGGRWRTDIDVYPYGDAPATNDSPLTDEDMPSESPTTDFQSSVSQASDFQSSVSQASIEDQREEQQEDPSSSPSAAAGDHLSEVSPEGLSHDVTTSPAAAPTAKTFPVVEQRKLVTWFGVSTPEQGQAWEAAWDTAQSFVTQGAVEYDPQAHLAIYLSKCREERRQPRSDLWLRFFIEDRAKHIATLDQQHERQERQEEDPQQREDRVNRSMPPADWGVTDSEEQD